MFDVYQAVSATFVQKVCAFTEKQPKIAIGMHLALKFLAVNRIKDVTQRLALFEVLSTLIVIIIHLQDTNRGQF